MLTQFSPSLIIEFKENENNFFKVDLRHGWITPLSVLPTETLTHGWDLPIRRWPICLCTMAAPQRHGPVVHTEDNPLAPRLNSVTKKEDPYLMGILWKITRGLVSHAWFLFAKLFNSKTKMNKVSKMFSPFGYIVAITQLWRKFFSFCGNFLF